MLLLTNKDFSIVMTGKLFRSCVRISCSETWTVKKETEMALQRAEMRTIRWMYVLEQQRGSRVVIS